MPNNPGSIADASSALLERRLFVIVLALAGVAGLAAIWLYAQDALTLSHYDARGHLVVSRRVVDSLTPGWRQLGAVWLPLPHLLNLVPVQWDWAYRTGIPGAIISSAILAWGLASLARCVVRSTGSVEAALIGPILILANPNVLYLQSTPMTEPILFGLALIATDAVARVLAGRGAAVSAGVSLAALVLTRYEGWLIAAALLAIAAAIAWRRRRRLPAVVFSLPAGALLGFLVLSWASTGRWIASADFYVPDPQLLRQPAVVFDHFRRGVLDLGGYALVWGGAGGLIVVGATARRRPERWLFVTMFAAAALPLWAFYQGHPYRVRYMMATVVALGVMAPFAVLVFPARLRLAAIVVMALLVTRERPPNDPEAPMLQEAQWETPFRQGRETVTAALAAQHDATPILASMGSLGHYMQETSHAGFRLRDFLHEGNGDLWSEALRAPRRSVRWVLIEGRAEGGDMLAALAERDPSFLEGFDRVSEGGGLVLYRRAD
jgi:hypothetical protein